MKKRKEKETIYLSECICEKPVCVCSSFAIMLMHYSETKKKEKRNIKKCVSKCVKALEARKSAL